MKKQKNKFYPDLILTAFLGLLIWVFFAVFYRHHLHYQEQLQLFLFTSDYFIESIVQPGGFAGYLNSFVTQFFYHSSTGAIILAVMLSSLHIQVSVISSIIGGKALYRPLACLPSLFFVLLLCHEDMLLSALIAALLVLSAVLFYALFKKNSLRIAYLLIMIPLLYWLVGFAVFIFPVFCLYYEWIIAKRINKRILTFISLIAVGLLLSVPLFAQLLQPQYPLSRFWMAGDYYRFVTHINPAIFYTLLSIIIIPVLTKWLPDIQKKGWRIGVRIVQFLLLFIVIDWIIGFGADWKKEELMGYDYYVRTKKWTNIIDKANKLPPDSPKTVAALNLALSKRGYMGDYLFYYFQNGSDGLIPNHTADYILPVMIGEIYYNMGLINSAQRFTFEAMESIPDYRKSVRCLQRLAETNLINKQYKVAEKYLTILQHTLFYKDWASDVLSFLYNEDRINAHPEWGELRRFMLKEDCLFMNEDKELLFTALLEQNPHNHVAADYLLAQNLLDKELIRFQDNLQKRIDTIGGEALPLSYQEALLFVQDLTGQSEGIYAYISDEIRQRYEAYKQARSGKAQPGTVIRENFGNTYWYYLHYLGGQLKMKNQVGNE